MDAGAGRVGIDDGANVTPDKVAVSDGTMVGALLSERMFSAVTEVDE